MTNAELLAKIKAEIERMKSLSNQLDYKNAVGFNWALDDVLSFLDTLESEKPMDQEGLEEELDRYLRGEFQQTAGGNFNNYIQVARHFAKWGAEHLLKI